MQTSIGAINHTVQKTHQWLQELKELGNFYDEEQAYSALRAVLHALRDRLLPEEATHLGAQLPMLVRGFYYEGWKLSQTPNKERTQEKFIQNIQAHLRNANASIDAKSAAKAVFTFLEKHISSGEIAHIKAELPKPIKVLWESSD